MPYHPGPKKEAWLPLSHFLELQVVAASLKSMLGLEEVKAWSCCFLFLNSEFEELMRDPIEQIFLSTGLYIPLLGAILRNAIDQGRHWGVRILEMGHLPLSSIDAIDEFLWSGFPWYIFGNTLSCYL